MLRLPSVLFIRYTLIKYRINQPVVLRLLRIHEIITVRILGDGVQLLAGMMGQDRIQGVTDLQNLTCVDLNM